MSVPSSGIVHIPELEFFLNRHFERTVKGRYGGAVKYIFQNFTDLLVAHTKKGFSIESSLRAYGICFSAHRRVGPHDAYPFDIDWETQLGFILCANPGKEAVPIAYIGFERFDTRLTVYQIESVAGREACLAPIYWERLLYTILLTVAQQIGYREVHVLPAAYSQNYIPTFDNDLSCRVWRITGESPERCGFQWDDEAKAFIYVIP